MPNSESGVCPGDQLVSEAWGNMGTVGGAIRSNMIWQGFNVFSENSQVRALTKQAGGIMGSDLDLKLRMGGYRTESQL